MKEVPPFFSSEESQVFDRSSFDNSKEQIRETSDRTRFQFFRTILGTVFFPGCRDPYEVGTPQAHFCSRIGWHADRVGFVGICTGICEGNIGQALRRQYPFAYQLELAQARVLGPAQTICQCIGYKTLRNILLYLFCYCTFKTHWPLFSCNGLTNSPYCIVWMLGKTQYHIHIHVYPT